MEKSKVRDIGIILFIPKHINMNSYHLFFLHLVIREVLGQLGLTLNIFYLFFMLYERKVTRVTFYKQ